MEFEGVPDKENIFYFSFNSGIEFREDMTCTAFTPKINKNNTLYDLGGFLSGKHTYTLNGNELFIDEKLKYTILSLEEKPENKDILLMDLHLTLEQTQYNYGRLNKLRRQGTGETVIIHYTFQRSEN